MNTTTILMTDECDSENGYLISESRHTPMIHAMFWTKDRLKKVSYLDLKDFYEKSMDYVQSDLIHFNPLHQMKHRMCQAFIRYYETKDHR